MRAGRFGQPQERAAGEQHAALFHGSEMAQVVGDVREDLLGPAHRLAKADEERAVQQWRDELADLLMKIHEQCSFRVQKNG